MPPKGRPKTYTEGKLTAAQKQSRSVAKSKLIEALKTHYPDFDTKTLPDARSGKGENNMGRIYKLIAEEIDKTIPEKMPSLMKNLIDSLSNYKQVQGLLQASQTMEQKLLPEQKSAPVQTDYQPVNVVSSEPPPEQIQEQPKIPTKSKYSKIEQQTESRYRPKNYKVLSMTNKPPIPKQKQLDMGDYDNDILELKREKHSQPRPSLKEPEVAITPDAKTIPAEAGAENLIQNFGASLSRAGVDALTNAGAQAGVNVLMGAANLRDPRNRLMDGRRGMPGFDPLIGTIAATTVAGGIARAVGNIAADAYNAIYPRPLQPGQAQNAQNSDGQSNAPKQPEPRENVKQPELGENVKQPEPEKPQSEIRTRLENRIKEFKIETPMTEKLISTKQTTGDILTTQEQPESRGFLKPKFIIPSSDIFNKSIQEEYIDDLEFSMFDFVKDDTGGLDPNNDNFLMRDQKLTEALRYQNSGVTVPSLYGQKPKYTQNLFIPKDETKIKIPEISFLYGDAINEFNLSEFETKIYDPSNDRTAIDIASPYYYMTDNQLLDQYIDTSILYGVVP